MGVRRSERVELVAMAFRLALRHPGKRGANMPAAETPATAVGQVNHPKRLWSTVVVVC
jgi:hypothetical protein